MDIHAITCKVDDMYETELAALTRVSPLSAARLVEGVLVADLVGTSIRVTPSPDEWRFELHNGAGDRIATVVHDDFETALSDTLTHMRGEVPARDIGRSYRW